MPNRTPRDGQPYYCAKCGAGFGEYIACEQPNCELETQASAELRRLVIKSHETSEAGGGVAETSEVSK